jgi:hypothetical protein
MKMARRSEFLDPQLHDMYCVFVWAASSRVEKLMDLVVKWYPTYHRIQITDTHVHMMHK